MAERRRVVATVGLLAGPIGAVALFAIVPTETLSLSGRATLALMVWMATWWLTEAVDVAATALLPLAVLPIVTVGAFDSAKDAMRAAAGPYADPFIALFLGGFMMALAMERWGLHRRIALVALLGAGRSASGVVACFMLITAVLSMWVSNTATTVMMLPIALSVLDRAAPDGEPPANLSLCLLLGIAYSASIGGIGTLIGTPPNAFLAGFLAKEYGIEIGFGQWLLVGLPLVVIFLPIVWFALTRLLHPVRGLTFGASRAMFRDELRGLGPMKSGEWVTFIVFMTAATSWIFRVPLNRIEIGGVAPLSGLTDAGIAMIAGLLLMAIPVSLRRLEFTLDWATAKRVPWGILILFGGGLGLAGAVSRHGVAEVLGAQVGALGAWPAWAIVLVVVTGVIFLTELTSNTATTATLLPILAGVAAGLDIEPMRLLVPAALAASCAFMMPVATPPNAVVFGSGRVTIPQMCRAGLMLNIVGIVLVTLLAYAVVGRVLGRVG